MAQSGRPWFQMDDSWRKTTAHGSIHKGLIMSTIDGVVRRLPVEGKDGSIDLIKIDGIFYLEAQGEKPLIRAKHFR